MFKPFTDFVLNLLQARKSHTSSSSSSATSHVPDHDPDPDPAPAPAPVPAPVHGVIRTVGEGEGGEAEEREREVKMIRAKLVVRWVTTCEALVLNVLHRLAVLAFLFFFLFLPSLIHICTLLASFFSSRAKKVIELVLRPRRPL